MNSDTLEQKIYQRNKRQNEVILYLKLTSLEQID